MMIKTKTSKFIQVAFLTLTTLLSLFPFYMVIIMSTYYTNDLYKGLPIFPSNYFMTNLQTILKTNFVRVYFNSLFVSISAMVLSCLTASLIGYAIAKFEFKGRNMLRSFILATMMIPTQVGIIGYVLEMKALGLNGTIWPLIFAFAASPFAAFFLLQFTKSAVPDEVIESARIDGCSESGIFVKMVIPFIKPAISTTAILIFLWSWNNYLLPLVSINDNNNYTIPLLISTLSSEFVTDFAAQMTAVGFAIIPIIVLFICGSKTFIEGLATGSVKG